MKSPANENCVDVEDTVRPLEPLNNPLYVCGVCVTVLNGLKRWTLVSPTFVMVKLFALLSISWGDWQVRSDVFVIGVKGVVLGVKLLV